MSWEPIASAKRASLLGLIPPEWRLDLKELPSPSRLRDFSGYIIRFLNPRELHITDSPSDAILAEIRSGEWSAVEVTRAFCHRAAIAHQLTNCLSEVAFNAAEQRAQELDEYFFRTGQLIGPLHGLPISMKDRFNIEGLETACGYVSWLGKRKCADSEGVLVKTLRHAGAILFVKTNVPMSMLMGETNNNIVGSTVNPYNRHLSAGGASGGEGALLALKGSPLGWGSDIAGSIRIPCAFNNLYGLKPTFGRLPAGGMGTSLPGLPTAGGVVGPMALDVSALELALKVALNACPWKDDCDVIEMPWRQDKLQSIRTRMSRPGEKDGKLVFAVMKCDSSVQPHPPVQRALAIVTEALSNQGYEVVEWHPPLHNDAVQVLFQILGCTAGKEVRKAIDASGEPPVHQLRDWYNNDDVESSSSADFWRLCEQRDNYRADYNRYWASARGTNSPTRQVDGVIMPVAPTAAVEDGLFKYYSYSGIVNLLDYTAGSFPVTFADRSIDLAMPDYVPMNEADSGVWRTYQEDLFDGAPVGLQVMGRRHEEEKVIGLMEAISVALQETRTGQQNASFSLHR